MRRTTQTLVFAVLLSVTSLAYADQGSFTNSGGTTSVGSGATVNSVVASPAGSLSLTCPSPTSCSGGSLTYLSNDGTTSLNATFTSGTFVEGCSGGGRGGHITCSYTLTGNFSGTLTVNGQTQAINGVTYQWFGTGGAAAQGTTAYNSAYTPFYYSDSEQILRSDDLMGTNQITFGSQGSGTNQFYGAYGIAVDSLGRIYVADTYNCRVVRIDDMNGTNWTTYGSTCGSGPGQFSDPSAIAVDSLNRIYVMDTNNARLVRIDDMSGTNWITFGSAGSGVNQFASFGSVAVDSNLHIYVADGGNRRIVRMDDMIGTNWTILTQSPTVNGASYTFQDPAAVAIDSAGKIYILDLEYYQPAVVRVDDMTGANWTSLYVGSAPTNSIGVDSTGLVYVGGGGVRVIDNMAGVLTSSGTVAPYGSYYVFGITPVPLPSPHPPAMTLTPTALTFANQNIGTSSVSQPVTITNFGGSPLNLSSISANGGFIDNTACPVNLIAGSNCTVDVSFAPSSTGPANGVLTLFDNSANLGTEQSVTLSGLATAPAAYVVPKTADFPAQLLNTPSAAQSVVLQNTGTGPLHVASVVATAPFTQTNNCNASIAPGAGCTVLVSFTPTATGSASGSLTVNDNAGQQTISLAGTGSTTTATVTVSPASLLFPPQLLNTKSGGLVVTIMNTGKTAVANSGVTITEDFARTTTCTASLPASKSCTVTVTFTPTAAKLRTGTLTINLATGARTVALSGTGSTGSLPGVLSFSPASLDFASYVIGDNPSKSVTVTNTSGAAIGISAIALVGGKYLTERNKCGSLLAAGASCSVTVTFVPKTVGTFTSTLKVTESSGAQDTVPVTGICVPGN
jgi:hypothetical protein